MNDKNKIVKEYIKTERDIDMNKRDSYEMENP